MGTDFNYDDTSHQVIFDHINGGSGSGPLQDASQGWQKLGQEIGTTGKSYAQSVISNILANRTGAAAEAAVSTTSAMLPWMDNVTQVAAASAQRAQEQADLPVSSHTAYGAATAPAMAGGGVPAHLMAAHQSAGHQPVAVGPAAHRPLTQAPTATVSQLAGGPHATPPAGRAASSQGWAGAGNAAASQGVAPGALAASAAVGGDSAGRERASGRRGSAGVPVAGASGAHHAGFGSRPSTEFGPRPTASSHSTPDELSGARHSAATTRAASAGGYGQPFAGGAGQQGEQDREHRSKYLLHDDSHSIVGDLPATAPPVIGADY